MCCSQCRFCTWDLLTTNIDVTLKANQQQHLFQKLGGREIPGHVTHYTTHLLDIPSFQIIMAHCILKIQLGSVKSLNRQGSGMLILSLIWCNIQYYNRTIIKCYMYNLILYNYQMVSDAVSTLAATQDSAISQLSLQYSILFRVPFRLHYFK